MIIVGIVSSVSFFIAFVVNVCVLCVGVFVFVNECIDINVLCGWQVISASPMLENPTPSAASNTTLAPTASPTLVVLVLVLVTAIMSASWIAFTASCRFMRRHRPLIIRVNINTYNKLLLAVLCILCFYVLLVRRHRRRILACICWMHENMKCVLPA